MAKIPTIAPGSAQLEVSKITTQSPLSLQTQVTGSGSGVESLGSDIEKSSAYLYQKLDEARNFTEIAQAEAYDAKMISQELLKAETAVDKLGRPRQGTEEDFKDHDEVFRRSEEAVSGFFSNKEIESRYKSERQKKIIATRSQISRKYQQNMIDSGKASLLDSIAKDVENYYDAPATSGPMVMLNWKPDRNYYKEKIKSTISEGVRLGFLGETNAQILGEKLKTEMSVGLAESGIQKDPTSALIELKKGAEGEYFELNHDERIKLMDKAEEKILKDKNIAEKNLAIARNKNESDSLDLYRKMIQTPEGPEKDKLIAELTYKVNNDRDMGVSDANFASSMIKALNSPKTVTAKTDVMVYEEIMRHITNSDMTASEIHDLILTRYAEGKLTISNVEHLLYVEKGDEGISTIFTDMLTEEKNREKGTVKQVRPKKDFWGTAWKIIMYSTPVTSVFTMAKSIERAKKEGAKGEKVISIAKDEVRKQRLLNHPEIGNIPQNGKLYTDKYGNRAIIFPNGDIEEVQSSTGEVIPKVNRRKE